MTSIKVRLYTYRATKKGTFPLVFQIIHKREKRVIHSSYNIGKDYFDKVQGKVINHRRKKQFNADEINSEIRKTIGKLERMVEILDEKGRDYSVSDIASLYKSYRNSSLVLVYIRKLIDQLRDENRLTTMDSYQSTFNRLVRFLGNNENLYFSDITPSWLTRFIRSLQKSGLKENTVCFYCRILRAVYNKANREGIKGTTGDSPFRHLTFGREKTSKRAVSGESIRQIVKADVGSDKKLELARDLFLFSFYSRGMSFIDMACLKHENIVDNIIYYHRRKTRQPLRVKLVPQLIKIIEKYRSDGEYVLPILSKGDRSLYNQYRSELRKFNNHLRQLSGLLGLSTPLTSYVARHSWATLARNAGASVSVISEGLGHSSEKITYTYLMALDPILIDSINDKMSNMYF